MLGELYPYDYGGSIVGATTCIRTLPEEHGRDYKDIIESPT